MLNSPLKIKDNRLGNIRNTFGIIDRKTGKRFEDVRVSFREERTIHLIDLVKGYLTFQHGIQFLILYNSHVYSAVQANGFASCIVSFQTRDSGCYAVVRLKARYERYHTMKTRAEKGHKNEQA